MTGGQVRGLVLDGPKRVRLTRSPSVPLEPGHVRVRTVACGVCGSDLRRFREGVRPGPRWGHELVGEIVAVTDADHRGWLGQGAIAAASTPCRQCSPCVTGRPEDCREWTYHEAAGFADYVDVPARLITPVAEGVDPIDALTEPLYVAQDLVRRAALAPGDRALVLGLGPIGLLALHCLRVAGVDEVYAVYRTPGARSDLAGRWGAQPLSVPEFAARAADLRAAAAIITAPYAAVAAATTAVAPGGRVVYNGISAETSVPLDFGALHTGRVDLLPSFPHPQTGFGAARAALRRDRETLAAVVTHQVPLSRAPTAFALLDTGPAAAIKVLITPDPDEDGTCPP